MAFFTNIRKSHKQAKEHQAKLAEQKKKEEQNAAPYKHVPTHAATDAFASAPPTWREAADRPRIVEENRRRSAMIANGQLNMPAPNFPRVGSSLSYVSYPGKSSPRARIPRAYSYNGVSPYPDGSRDIIYSIPDVAHSEPEGFKEPMESNSDSTGSQEDLEMRNPKRLSGTRSRMDNSRLHPKTKVRPVSDATLDRRPRSSYRSSKAGSSGYQRDSGPPPSTRGFSSIPSPALAAPIPVGTAPMPLPAAAIAPDAPSGPRKTSIDSSRHNSSSSLPGLTPTSTTQASPAAPASPPPGKSLPSELHLTAMAQHQSPSTSPENPKETTAPAYHAQNITKTTRFTEIESSESSDGHSQAAFTGSHAIINFLPEPAGPMPEPIEPKKAKGKKLSKGGGRLVKKNRRSTVEGMV